MSKAQSELDEALEVLDFLQSHIRSAGEVDEPKTTVEVAALATVQRRRLLVQLHNITQQIEDLQRSDDWQAVPPVELDDEVAGAKIDRMLDAWEEADAKCYGLSVEEMAAIDRAMAAKAKAASNFVSFAFLGNQGATMFNRTVHAVPGKPSRYPFNFWDTPALCGVKPQRLKNWGWIGDCSVLHLSCQRCEQTLQTMPYVIKLPDCMGGGFKHSL